MLVYLQYEDTYSHMKPTTYSKVLLSLDSEIILLKTVA